MWNSGRQRLVVTGVVADPVNAVRAVDVPAAPGGNAFVVVPRSALEVLTVSTPDGERQVPLPPLML
jgi:hypothetical protein